MYGIIGYPLLTTFSPGYFKEKFRQLGLDETYDKFPLEKIDDLKEVLKRHPLLKGLNVTIPYKQAVIPFLNGLDDTAKQIGAVNTIKIEKGKLIGYNTDTIGFYNSLKSLLQQQHNQALILGTGGASKAVAYALQQLEIPFQFVSREKKDGQLSYSDLTDAIVASHKLIINTTPLGMKPFEGIYPDIPYSAIDTEHLLYDLIYSPEETPFLKQGKERSASIKNGYEMLTGQAEAAWKIWNER
jgi:shikimate dehydrogenase